jgi:outer membrane protein assembly factor BamB
LEQQSEVSRGASAWRGGVTVAVLLTVAGMMAACATGKGPSEDWPWWRGPTLDGKNLDADPPLAWTETENIIWRTPVPGRGHSTPSIRGDRIFLQTADEEKKIQYVNCYLRDTGEELWSAAVHEGAFMPANGSNSQASSTPACDMKRVYAAFPNGDAIRLTALDHDGNIVWQEVAGLFKCGQGYGASPTLYKSFVIVAGDNDGESFLKAFHRETGEQAWKVKRPTVGSYVSPVVGTVAGRDQLLMSSATEVISYDPLTGEKLWFSKGPALVMAATLVFSGDLVVATGGFPQKELFCLRADGTGDVGSSNLIWQTNRRISYVPSPVIHDGKLYAVNDKGIVSGWTLETGEELWMNRLEGNFTASPTYAGGRFYIPNLAGVTFVFRVEPEFEILARNDLGDGGNASPVICGDRIYLRTNRYLYCIGKS